MGWWIHGWIRVHGWLITDDSSDEDKMKCYHHGLHIFYTSSDINIITSYNVMCPCLPCVMSIKKKIHIIFCSKGTWKMINFSPYFLLWKSKDFSQIKMNKFLLSFLVLTIVMTAVQTRPNYILRIKSPEQDLCLIMPIGPSQVEAFSCKSRVSEMDVKDLEVASKDGQQIYQIDGNPVEKLGGSYILNIKGELQRT